MIGESVIVPGIVILLPSRCESTILRGIPTFIVDAFKRVQGTWTWSHICVEILKLSPTITYGDTTPPIIGIRSISRICRAVNHMMPHAIFRSHPAPLGHPMSQAIRSHRLRKQTATALRVPIVQAVPAYYREGATRADTEPIRPRPSPRCGRPYGQSRKDSTGNYARVGFSHTRRFLSLWLGRSSCLQQGDRSSLTLAKNLPVDQPLTGNQPLCPQP